jgi:Flp pilus assembly protein TadB
MPVTTFYTLVAAFCLGLGVWQLTVTLQAAGPRGAQALADYAGHAPPPTLLERVGAWLLRVTHLDLAAWALHLRWAQLGQTASTTLALLVGQSVLLGGVLGLVAVFTGVPFFGLAALIATAYPWVRLQGQAETVRRQVRRALPEVASLLAAEMAAGVPPETALSRASELPGPMATLLRSAIETQRQTQRPLFTRPGTPGVLVETLATWGLAPLSSFAKQIDLAAQKGVEGAAQMSRVAQGLARQYRETLQRNAEGLENQLLLPTMLFIFLPFLVAVLATIGLPIMGAF